MGLIKDLYNQLCTLLAELFDFSNHSQLTLLSAVAESDPVALSWLLIKKYKKSSSDAYSIHIKTF